jgi:outer membrane protein OmpA-like peptidoglycan-associated protein
MPNEYRHPKYQQRLAGSLMIALSDKTVALYGVFCLLLMMPCSAHAGVLRSSNGEPVLSSNGSCVTTGFEGSDGCKRAVATIQFDQSAGAIKPHKRKEVEPYRTEDRFTAIYFDYNASDLEHAKSGNDPERSPSAKVTIDHMLEGMQNSSYSNDFTRDSLAHDAVELTGYTDAIGGVASNKKLALKRAAAVRDYLIATGIEAKRIKILVGFAGDDGEELLPASCGIDPPKVKRIACLWADRRTEIRFVRYVRYNPQ